MEGGLFYLRNSAGNGYKFKLNQKSITGGHNVTFKQKTLCPNYLINYDLALYYCWLASIKFSS